MNIYPPNLHPDQVMCDLRGFVLELKLFFDFFKI